eukprot:TRINITY_DN8936_c0_g1_i1.p1 TRINITY_DN8936_c0_g1~~TRINITY_DN8936_c0_g1_i1.p1  ORF type:complete len:391 (+),score=-47.71 TRINITY_DN8936_c0_g1_i1:275-1447(+)
MVQRRAAFSPRLDHIEACNTVVLTSAPMRTQYPRSPSYPPHLRSPLHHRLNATSPPPVPTVYSPPPTPPHTRGRGPANNGARGSPHPAQHAWQERQQQQQQAPRCSPFAQHASRDSPPPHATAMGPMPRFPHRAPHNPQRTIARPSFRPHFSRQPQLSNSSEGRVNSPLAGGRVNVNERSQQQGLSTSRMLMRRFTAEAERSIRVAQSRGAQPAGSMPRATEENQLGSLPPPMRTVSTGSIPLQPHCQLCRNRTEMRHDASVTWPLPVRQPADFSCASLTSPNAVMESPPTATATYRLNASDREGASATWPNNRLQRQAYQQPIAYHQHGLPALKRTHTWDDIYNIIHDDHDGDGGRDEAFYAMYKTFTLRSPGVHRAWMLQQISVEVME